VSFVGHVAGGAALAALDCTKLPVEDPEAWDETAKTSQVCTMPAMQAIGNQPASDLRRRQTMSSAMKRRQRL